MPTAVSPRYAAKGTGPADSFTYNAGSTVFTDPNGHGTTYDYDFQGRVTKVVDALGHVTSQAYTSDSNVSVYTDGTGAQTQYAYDGRNNLTQVTLPTGAGVSLAYGDAAHPFYPTAQTDPQGNTTQYAYDAAGNLVQVTDALGHVTKYAYNANGTLASVTDANGNVTTYQYDAAGNLTGITNPAPLGATTYTYDSLSRLASMTDGKGQKTSYAYDVMDRLVKVTYADGTAVSFSYDADGNRTAMTDATGTTSYTYDALNRVTQKTLPGGQTITYAWDGEGNLTGKTDSGGTVTLGYDAVNLLTSIQDPTGATTRFAYDAAYRRTQVAYPNGVTVGTSYNAAGQVTGITDKDASGAVLLSLTYSYVNPLTNAVTALRYSVTDQNGSVTAYGYDALNRLTLAKVTDSAGTVTDDRSWTYDAVGNRLSQVINGVKTNYSYNAANELTAAGSLTYSYDANGNLTGRSDGLSLNYNAANFTVGITPPGGTAIAMAYTGLDQTERVKAGNAAFVYDLMGLSQRSDTSGTVYDLRDNTGQLVSERTANGTYYVLFDALGSTIGLTDASGKLVGTWQYDPWGNVIKSTGTVTTPFLFDGAYWDQATGFYKMGARYYDPSVGRWTQRDPSASKLQRPDTVNVYLFISDNPVNAVDFSGYDWVKIVFSPCLVVTYLWWVDWLTGYGVILLHFCALWSVVTYWSWVN